VKKDSILKTVSLTELNSDLHNLIDEVIETGIPLELKRDGKKLLITLVSEVPRTERLFRRKEAFIGDSDDLLDMNWEKET